MENPRRTLIGLAIIALVALLFVAVPGGGEVGELIGDLIHAGFLALIAVGLTQLYRRRADWLAELPERERVVLYGATSVALLAIVGAGRLRELGGDSIILLLAVLAVCGFAVYQVWYRSQQWPT